MFRSIRWRIAIPFVILIIAVTVFIGLHTIDVVRDNYLRTLEESMLTLARLIGDEISSGTAIVSENGEFRTMILEKAALIKMRISFIQQDGTVLVDSAMDADLMDNHANRPEVALALSGKEGISIRHSATLVYDMFYAAVPVQLEAGEVGVVRLALPLIEIEEKIAELQRVWLLTAIFVSVAAIALAALVSQQISKPLRDLTKNVTNFSGTEDYKAFPKTMQKNEIELLKISFDNMSSSIQEKIQVLERESSKLNAIMEEVKDGIVIVDSTNKIQLINLAAKQIFGIENEHPEDFSLVEVTRIHQIIDMVEKCRATGQLQTDSFEVMRTKRFVQATALANFQSLPGLIVLVFHDLTQQRRTEVLRREFISNVSHELRNPLSVIKLLTETLHDGAIDNPEQAAHFLEQIEQEVDSLTLLVNELLELSRVESGKLPLQLEPTHPKQIITHAVERLSIQAQHNLIEFNLSVSEDLPQIMADTQRLEQVLVNLMHNAIKFSPTGSRVTISAREVGEDIQFCVEDKGVGIAPSDLEHIFERFYKVDRSRSDTGTGLGLSLSRHLVLAHGGKIWAESELGVGSRFYFTIRKITSVNN